MNNNKINSICKSLNLTFQKQNKSEKDIDQIQQFLTNTNFMKDLSHPLLIIKTQNMSILVLEAIKELEDNAYPLLKEQYSKLSIKTFNISYQDSLNSYLCQTIKLLCQNITQFQLQQNICDLLKMLEEIYILQQNEQIANSLIFQCVQNEFQNEIFQTILLYNLYSQQVLNKNKKYLFINISGLNTMEQDFKFMKEVNLLKKSNKNMDVYYLSFHKKELQARQNKRFSSNQLFEQYFLEIQQDHQITWPQLKPYFKPIIKRKIQLFNPQVCVLQLFISLDKVEDKDGLKLEIECIFKIIHYFQKISKDKLLINLLIKDSESNVQRSIELTNIFKQEQDFQLAKNVQLKQIINAIEQGIFGKIKVEIVDKRSYDQILIDFKCQLNQIQNQKYQEELQRSFNNLICQQKIQFENSSEIEDLEFHYIPFINNNRSLLFFQFYYNQNKIKINNSTQVFLKQKEQIVIIFQVQEFKLYYCKIECNCVKKDCHLLNLQLYQNFNNIKNDESMKAPIIAIIEDKIYLNYGYLGDQIWEFNIINQNIIFKRRIGLQKYQYLQDAGEQQKYILERDGASVFYNLFEDKENNHYFISGGELGQNSPLCNIIERVFPEKNGFSSGFVVKSLFKVSLKPFQHSLVLEGNQYVIFLPGDYNKKVYKYSQVINHQHYQYAQRLSVRKNDWVIEKIKIIYDNEELGRLYPIHLMPNNQQIIYNIEKDHWIVCFFRLQLQPVGSNNLFSQQIYKDENNQNEFHYETYNKINEGNLCFVIIKMEIKYYQDQLLISITPFQLGKNRSIIKNTVKFKN